MSKSEYKRLAVQLPSVIKTIRNHVLNEALDVVLKEPDYISRNQEYRRGYVKAVNQMKIEIEALKEAGDDN